MSVPPNADRRKRFFALLVLLAGIALLAWFALAAPTGRYWADQGNIRTFLAAHSASGPLVFLAIYTIVGCTMTPLWPLQSAAGFVFGPVLAVVLCQAGNAVAGFATTALSGWFARGVRMKKVEPLLARLRHFEHRLGSTGIPLVMGTRLIHFVPFGPSNVAFGILGVRPRDVAVGTLLGNVGSVAFYATLGSAGGDPGARWSLLWRMVVGLVALNLLLLTPLVWRYRLSSGRPARRQASRDSAADARDGTVDLA
jgi:uncharacterized membrane protein YdjX (TVP38/TMEM64 family)